MSSSFNLNSNDMMLSPSRVTFNSVDLGGTKDGVTFSLKTKTTDLKIDQLGDTPVDTRVTGQEGSLKFTLVGVKNKDNWKVAFPFAKLIDGGGSGKAVYMDSQIGFSLLSAAQELLLHPLDNDDTDKSMDIKFFKVASVAAVEVKLDSKDQIGLAVEMRVFPDRTSSPPRYFFLGDPAIGAVNASAAAAVAGGSNVGNGTVSGVSVPANAVGETITIKCIAAALNGGIFEVSGSVSGPLGNATVGAPFISSQINLTMNDGTTDFAVNDQFTIAVTGPNWA